VSTAQLLASQRLHGGQLAAHDEQIVSLSTYFPQVQHVARQALGYLPGGENIFHHRVRIQGIRQGIR
jgi:hypothetical protein